MSDDYSRFEVIQAAYQAWEQGFADATSLATQIKKQGAERLNEDRRKWHQENPDKPWLWENPHAEEYLRLKTEKEHTDG